MTPGFAGGARRWAVAGLAPKRRGSGPVPPFLPAKRSTSAWVAPVPPTGRCPVTPRGARRGGPTGKRASAWLTRGPPPPVRFFSLRPLRFRLGLAVRSAAQIPVKFTVFPLAQLGHLLALFCLTFLSGRGRHGL